MSPWTQAAHFCPVCQFDMQQLQQLQHINVVKSWTKGWNTIERAAHISLLSALAKSKRV